MDQYEVFSSQRGHKLRRLREERNWTQEDASERLDIPMRTLQRGERGERLRVSTINKLAKGYKVSLQDIIAPVRPPSFEKNYASPISYFENKFEEVPSKIWGTGIADLDEMLGGFKPGDLVVIGSRTGQGATSLSLGVVRHFQFLNGASYICSDMSVDHIRDRILSNDAKVSFKRIHSKQMTEQDWARITRAAAFVLDEKQISFSNELGLSKIESAAASFFAHTENKPKLLIIDKYASILWDTKGKPGSERELHRQTVIGLKNIARKLGCIVILVTHIPSKTENFDVPQLGEIYDPSDTLIAESDFVILTQIPYLIQESAVLGEIVVAKNRRGPTGFLNSAFIPTYMSWENLAKNPNKT